MKVAAHESLTGLYRKIVLDHSRHPHHFGRMENCQHVATGHNPLCGDKITLYIKMDGDFIADGTFEASACAICMASASMMMDAIHGQGQAAARSLVHDFLGMFDRPPGAGPGGELASLSGVLDFPSRIRCATLPWQTLTAALDDNRETVTTETRNTSAP